MSKKNGRKFTFNTILPAYRDYLPNRFVIGLLATFSVTLS